MTVLPAAAAPYLSTLDPADGAARFGVRGEPTCSAEDPFTGAVCSLQEGHSVGAVVARHVDDREPGVVLVWADAPDLELLVP